MLPIRAVMAIVDKDEDAVLMMVELGQLLWAFDVACMKGRGSKELRIFPKCVGEFLAGRPCRIEFDEVVRALVRGETDTIAAMEISAVLNVSSTQVYHLIRAGQLRTCSDWHTGPGGSAPVSVESFVKFLRQRAYPVPVSDK
jgi:hypothetical protein